MIPFSRLGDLSGNGKTNTDDESASKPKASSSDAVDRGLESCEKGWLELIPPFSPFFASISVILNGIFLRVFFLVFIFKHEQCAKIMHLVSMLKIYKS